ncbi:MAG: ABC-type lipoprotein release transport system permease subunit, partial [Flavobacteriales bacterium]
MTNFYWYISKRISSGKGFKKGFSRPIIHIATGAVALGIAVMLISIAIVIGFQNEVRDKVVGFGSHVQISQNSGAQSKESIPMLTNDSLVSEIKKISSVKHVQKFAIKPGILETKKDVEGAIIKGVSSDFDWTFFNDKLVKGTTLSADSLEVKKHIMLSETIAKRLRINVGERLTVYFVLNQEDLKPRTFKVVGIYNSGFVEFDEQFVFVPLDIMAKISKWGIESQVKVTEEKEKNRWKVEGFGFGGEGLLKFEWSKMKWRGSGPHYLSYKDTSRIELIVRDRFETIPDTSRIMFSVDGEDPLRLLPLVVSSGGTHSEYCGGYEVLLTDYESILNADDALTFSLPYYYRS